MRPERGAPVLRPRSKVRNANPAIGQEGKYRRGLLMSSQRCAPGLQDDLEVKLKELQSKSDTVTSLGECCRQTLPRYL